MKQLSIIALIFSCFIIGLAFHAYQKEWIILVFPHQTADLQTQAQNSDDATFTQQKITLFFFKHEQWQKEHNIVIWSFDTAINAKTITNNWLTLLEDEKLIDTDVQLLSAVITNKELFLSFNKNLFDSQNSTYTKLMILHSLLKTVHENKIPVQSVRFLVHHQTLIDDHLNFSISWPITGYIPIS